ncbi:MAG: D-glycero-beta-D-manno-heptose 1-phosphate adenylyltransferase [Candidatus Aureabacteria bacterium]|nr:D-glycero-beta-D-manno-heptose 1-phosphate adenylyltransferase [Candidatus Auribacterota bacterium]
MNFFRNPGDFLHVFQKKEGSLLVFTNGCFDILHVGHVRTLEASRTLGSFLVVGLNSDSSVRRIKGPGRPINKESDRAEMLLALKCVDAVVFFDEDTPYELIKTIRPDVLTKGGDYTKSDIIGGDMVESWGGKVAVIPYVEGYSTTELITSFS